MKTITYLVAIFSICVLMIGCVSVGKLPYESATSTALNKANFRVIKSGARGTDMGFRLLCILPLIAPSYADAMQDLRSEANMVGKAATLMNVTQDESQIILLLFSLQKITITADIIEFIE